MAALVRLSQYVKSLCNSGGTPIKSFLLLRIYTFFHLFIYIRYHSRMDISDEDLLNEDSLLVPATQSTQSPNSFSSGLIRRFSLKGSQAKPGSAETVINNTHTINPVA